MQLNEDDLHEYQNVAVAHIITHSHSALLLEMGLGKTVSTLTAIVKLIYEELEILTVLIIAPKRVAENVWTSEVDKWEHLQNLKIARVIGKEAKRKEALSENADIYVIGRDNVPWLCKQYGNVYLPFDMLVIDELSSFKNPQSARFKALKRVQPSFKRVVGLTGTPTPNSLMDLWSQVYLLDRGVRLGKFVTHFRKKYFTPGRTSGNIVYDYRLNEDAEKQIHEAIGDICMSMKAKDYLQLPARIENIIELEFDSSLKKKYKEFEAEKVLELLETQETDSEVTAANAAALSNKLLQFCNGAIYDEDKNWHLIHDLKIDATKEIIEDANEKPVLIAYTYKHDLERLLLALKKYKPVQLKTEQHIDDWNAGKIRVMIMHPASGGHGLNLQAGGNIIIWFGQTWSLELEQQFNARLDRQGQKNAVIINKLVIAKTLDEDVIKAQRSKDKTQQSLMQAVKARLEKYLK